MRACRITQAARCAGLLRQLFTTKYLSYGQTVGEFLVERLTAWGVKRIFVYLGARINGILAALNRADNTLEFIRVNNLPAVNLI